MSTSSHPLTELPRGLPRLPDGWSYEPLSQLIDARGISYGVVQPGTHDPSGVPIVRVNNLKNGRIITDDVLRVSPEIEAKHQRTRLRGGEVLMSLVGSLGECAIVPIALAGWNTARAVAVIPVRGDIGAKWVQICLQSRTTKHLIDSWATTTVQATLNLRDVAKLPIPIPPASIRHRVSEIANTIDDTIELNQEIGQTLQVLAMALFKSWFIDFAPVHAKARVRNEHPDWTNTEISSAALPRVAQGIAQLFPDRFENIDGQTLPFGWRSKHLDQIADYLNGLALQKFPPAGDHTIPAIKIAQLRAGHTFGADRVGAYVPTEFIVEDGDVLFSWSGSLEVELWSGGRGALNQHLFKVTSRDFPKWFYYLWTRHHLEEFRAIAAAKATTMGHIQRHHLSGATAVVPPPLILGAMTGLIQPLIDQQVTRKLTSRTIESARDELLKRLLAGDLTVDTPRGAQ